MLMLFSHTVLTLFFVVIRCEELSEPVNASLSLSAQNILGSIAEYSCDRGFSLEGNGVRVCTREGWTGSDPVCIGKIAYHLKSSASKESNGCYV